MTAVSVSSYARTASGSRPSAGAGAGASGTCQSGIPSGAHAADNIGRLVRNRKLKPFRFGYWHQPLSLGRNDAVIQFTRRDDTPRRLWITGSRAVAYKELVTSSPPTTYRIARRWTFPVAMLSARGGRATRRPPAEPLRS